MEPTATAGRFRWVSLDLIPSDVRSRYRIQQWGHACAILATDFPVEFDDLMDCLRRFKLLRSDILTPGGDRSPISSKIDELLHGRGWVEKRFDTQIVVDGVPYPNPTHKIDNYKNKIGVEVEWNNKTEFYDRDLNNFRLLRQLRVLSVGVIITRVSELQREFSRLGKGKSYGASTTHWDKLIPKIEGGGSGGCPILAVGLGFECYDRDG